MCTVITVSRLSKSIPPVTTCPTAEDHPRVEWSTSRACCMKTCIGLTPSQLNWRGFSKLSTKLYPLNHRYFRSMKCEISVKLKPVWHYNSSLKTAEVEIVKTQDLESKNHNLDEGESKLFTFLFLLISFQHMTVQYAVAYFFRYFTTSSYVIKKFFLMDLNWFETGFFCMEIDLFK